MQVVLILIDNAIRHSPQGGMVRITAAEVRGWGELSVTDEGPGIPASQRERIFEPFAQLPPRQIGPAHTGAAVGGGTGLGLAIARSILAGMNGDIRVADAGDRGSSFTIALPVV